MAFSRSRCFTSAHGRRRPTRRRREGDRGGRTPGAAAECVFGGILRIERIGGLLQHLADRLAAGIARPGRVDAFEDVGLGRIAGELVEVVEKRAAPLRRAEALALVHAAALRGDLGVGAAEERIEGADVDAQRRWRPRDRPA